MPEEVKESLAIIKNVHCGVGDYGKAALWFDTYVNECTVALQVFDWNQAKEVIEAAGVGDVQRLEGKSCWVREGNGLIRFVRMAKI